MPIPVAQGRRRFLEMSEVPRSNALDSGVTSFSFGEVSRMFFDHAIRGRYESGQLDYETIGRSKTIVPMLIRLMRGRFKKVYRFKQQLY